MHGVASAESRGRDEVKHPGEDCAVERMDVTQVAHVTSEGYGFGAIPPAHAVEEEFLEGLHADVEFQLACGSLFEVTATRGAERMLSPDGEREHGGVEEDAAHSSDLTQAG